MTPEHPSGQEGERREVLPTRRVWELPSAPDMQGANLKIFEEALGLLRPFYGREGIPENDSGVLFTFFSEVLPNALYHGNYGLSGPAAAAMQQAEALYAADPEKYQNLKIQVQLQADSSGYRLSVEDYGPGFDQDSLPDMSLPENLKKPSGRGLGILRSFAEEAGFAPLEIINKTQMGSGQHGSIVAIKKVFRAENS